MFSFEIIRSKIPWLLLGLSVFCAAFFKWTGSTSFLLSQTLFVIYLAVILLILNSGLFKYCYEAPVFFLIGAFLYELPKFPYYFGLQSPESFIEESGLLDSNYSIVDYYSASSHQLLYYFSALAILLIFYLYTRRFKGRLPNHNSNHFYKKEHYLLYAMAAAWIFSAIRLYVITNGNPLLLLLRRTGLPLADEIAKADYIVSLSSLFVLALIPILLTFKIIYNKKWKWVFLLYIPATTLSFLISGGRAATIYSIIASTILLMCFKKITFRSTLIIAIGLVLLFGLLGQARRMSHLIASEASSAMSEENLESHWYMEISTYQTQLRDEMIFENFSKYNAMYGHSYLNLVFFWMPRSWVGNLKPIFTDLYVGKHFFAKDQTGMPLTSMTESYLNFGYSGLLIFAIMGFLMGLLTNYLQTALHPIYQSLAIVLLVYSQTWYTTTLVYALQLFVLIFPIIYFLKRKRT